MKVVLHPGMTKAGSTTIQNFFTVHSQALEQAGIGYLEPQGSTKGLFDEVLRDLDDLLSRDPHRFTHIVISHESLFEAHEDVVVAFLDSMKDRGMPTRVVMVVRPVTEWIVSLSKQKAKALRGFRPDGGGPRAERLLETWVASPIETRLECPVEFVPLKGPGGLLGEFIVRSGCPVPEDWKDWPSASVNVSPSGRELALYAALNEAIAMAVVDAGLGPDAISGPEAHDTRKVLGRLISNGDHHRRPAALAMDNQFRTELIQHFVGHLEAILLEQVREPRAAKGIRSVMTECRAMLKDSASSEALADKWQSEFLEAAASGGPRNEERFRRWCRDRGRPDLAELMLSR